MSEYTVVPLESIEPVSDGRCAFRPVRHHLGISSFGVNAFTGVEVGDRIINEHDEKDEHEELYLVHSGRARFELGGETVDAPVGTLVYAKPGVLRTAFAEEPNTILIALGGEAGQALPGRRLRGLGADRTPVQGGPLRGGRRARKAGGRTSTRSTRWWSTTSPAARPWAAPTTRSSTSGSRSRGTRTSRSGPPATPTSSRCGRTRASRSCSPG